MQYFKCKRASVHSARFLFLPSVKCEDRLVTSISYFSSNLLKLTLIVKVNSSIEMNGKTSFLWGIFAIFSGCSLQRDLISSLHIKSCFQNHEVQQYFLDFFLCLSYRLSTSQTHTFGWNQPKMSFYFFSSCSHGITFKS